METIGITNPKPDCQRVVKELFQQGNLVFLENIRRLGFRVRGLGFIGFIGLIGFIAFIGFKEVRDRGEMGTHISCRCAAVNVYFSNVQSTAINTL